MTHRIKPGQTRDAWGLKCTCTAHNRYTTLHDSNCDLFQKLPADGATSGGQPRRTGYVREQQ
ncbi:hypothetical protein [Streptomyces sp. NPDC091383]|uniref:hypothetical protein n=1 Tax=Streptomyces sp. NPDC091383 TaxID=3365996 RepID=UPI00382CE012